MRHVQHTLRFDVAVRVVREHHQPIADVVVDGVELLSRRIHVDRRNEHHAGRRPANARERRHRFGCRRRRRPIVRPEGVPIGIADELRDCARHRPRRCAASDTDRTPHAPAARRRRQCAQRPSRARTADRAPVRRDRRSRSRARRRERRLVRAAIGAPFGRRRPSGTGDPRRLPPHGAEQDAAEQRKQQATRHLEGHLCAQLQLPRRVGRARDLAGRRQHWVVLRRAGEHRAGRRAEVRAVQQVEDLEPELQPLDCRRSAGSSRTRDPRSRSPARGGNRAACCPTCPPAAGRTHSC